MCVYVYMRVCVCVHAPAARPGVAPAAHAIASSRRGARLGVHARRAAAPRRRSRAPRTPLPLAP